MCWREPHKERNPDPAGHPGARGWGQARSPTQPCPCPAPLGTTRDCGVPLRVALWPGLAVGEQSVLEKLFSHAVALLLGLGAKFRVWPGVGATELKPRAGGQGPWGAGCKISLWPPALCIGAPARGRLTSPARSLLRRQLFCRKERGVAGLQGRGPVPTDPHPFCRCCAVAGLVGVSDPPQGRVCRTWPVKKDTPPRHSPRSPGSCVCHHHHPCPGA